MIGQEERDAYHLPNSFVAVRTPAALPVGGSVCANWHIHQLCPSRIARLRAASLPRRWLSLDTRVLGLRWRHRRLLLGAGDVGDGSGGRFSLDSSLLGLGRQRIYLLRRLLGSACRFLWRD